MAFVARHVGNGSMDVLSEAFFLPPPHAHARRPVVLIPKMASQEAVSRNEFPGSQLPVGSQDVPKMIPNSLPVNRSRERIEPNRSSSKSR